ncbi:hypothetical protein V5O48_011307 [Marasmius crinis-equi]|uniref:Uncharacterized protein n=1 Tax=Marasmius crinis-equi TaxID=585013 RepID=A0ABR3F5Z4_9AGAR
MIMNGLCVVDLTGEPDSDDDTSKSKPSQSSSSKRSSSLTPRPATSKIQQGEASTSKGTAAHYNPQPESSKRASGSRTKATNDDHPDVNKKQKTKSTKETMAKATFPFAIFTVENGVFRQAIIKELEFDVEEDTDRAAMWIDTRTIQRRVAQTLVGHPIVKTKEVDTKAIEIFNLDGEHNLEWAWERFENSRISDSILGFLPVKSWPRVMLKFPLHLISVSTTTTTKLVGQYCATYKIDRRETPKNTIIDENGFVVEVLPSGSTIGVVDEERSLELAPTVKMDGDQLVELVANPKGFKHIMRSVCGIPYDPSLFDEE